MSLFDYQVASRLNSRDTPFYALIMAAIMRADSKNANALRRCWPEVLAETQARYNAPGGLLEGERFADLKPDKADAALKLIKTFRVREHPADERGPCLCSDCEFSREVKKLLED